MPENPTEVLCSGCGEVFTHFLQDIADHNQAVVCPKCGQVHPQRLGKKSEPHKI